MDMSKAFGMVDWLHIFTELRKICVAPLYLWLMLFIYKNQQYEVKWGGSVSYQFSVKNVVRQGAVSSAILFAVYIDELLVLLRKSRLDCYIDSVFVGAFIFADDIVLLSASRPGLQSQRSMRV